MVYVFEPDEQQSLWGGMFEAQHPYDLDETREDEDAAVNTKRRIEAIRERMREHRKVMTETGI